MSKSNNTPFTTCSIDQCNNKAYCRTWCRAHYIRWQRYKNPLGGGPMQKTKAGEPLKFLKSLIGTTSEECILWPYAKSKSGYGQYWVHPKQVNAHRMMTLLAHGEPNFEDAAACHDNKGKPCKSRLCVNPNHLRWGSRKENEADKVKHGTNLIGTRHHSSKLTKKQVREVRDMKGLMGQRSAAKQLGISRTIVRNIWIGKTYQNIE